MSNECINAVKLAEIKDNFIKAQQNVKRRIILCAGTGCMAGGSMKVYDEVCKELKANGLDIVVELQKEKELNEKGVWMSKSGCQGFCQMGPLLSIEPDGILYVKVKPEDAKEIVEKTILHGEVIERLLYVDHNTGKHCKGKKEIDFYSKQHRVALNECGSLDPENVEEYISHGGYAAAAKAYLDMEPEAVCKMILDSGLRGRGGAGFPTGKKWDLTRVVQADLKYIVCNADEGDPGAFMDRSVMEGNPHAVIEGMMIAARAIGASEGYFYVRAEYPLAVKRITRAVQDAEKEGILGDNVFGTGLKLHLHVMEGAGAFVCGEETALMESVEGHRGMPRPKPPFPAQSGLWKAPTTINNVETLATVPFIVRNGVEEFRKMGTETSPGTKTFALTGHVVNTGLIEVPMGTTLRKIIFDIGGGVIDDNGNPWPDGFKTVQIGGPSGGCLTEEHLDMPLDFDSLPKVGAMVGSGGLVVMNKNTCMVSVARFFMQFIQNESCGKCIPCREGTKQMLNLLDEIIDGTATAETIETLEELAKSVRISSLCGLGKTAPNPVLATLRYFRDEVNEHVFNKRCPTNRCPKLSTPVIDKEKCKGCTACAKQCPVGAISGTIKQPHSIDKDKCIRCGSCVRTCKFGAISGVSA